MRIIVNIALVMAFAILFQLFLPWWSISLAAALVAFVRGGHVVESFVSAFLALFLLWAGYAWYIDQSSAHILSSKVALLLQLPSPTLLVSLSGLLGGLVAGLGGLTAHYLREQLLSYYQPRPEEAVSEVRK